MTININRDGSVTIDNLTFGAHTGEAIDIRSASSTRKQKSLAKAILAANAAK